MSARTAKSPIRFCWPALYGVAALACAAVAVSNGIGRDWLDAIGFGIGALVLGTIGLAVAWDDVR